MSTHTATSSEERGTWGSRLGFILAAAGSAVGLGNIWKFPYVTGKNGGGLFVVIYLMAVVAIGLPIMIAEILLGRMTQRSPIVAFRDLAGSRSPWQVSGWLGVIAGFVILSFYSIVAGWAVYYLYFAVTHGFSGMDKAALGNLFSSLAWGSSEAGGPTPAYGLVSALHALFMVVTGGCVIGGVQSGVERASRVLMPALFLMMMGLAIYGLTLEGSGQALDFMFGFHTTDFKPGKGFLEALGQAFFSLSLGMGAMLTYGSYLPKETNIFKSALWVASLDTFVALLASLVIFPITFTNGIEPSAGPGLVFVTLPTAFAEMAGIGRVLSIAFFALLVFAALTSAISLLEVVTSSFIDFFQWSRAKATLITSAIIFGYGMPSVVSSTFFDIQDDLSSNWLLPFGGMLIALYAAWFLGDERRDAELTKGGDDPSAVPVAAKPWLAITRFVVPLAVGAILVRSIASSTLREKVLKLMGVGS